MEMKYKSTQPIDVRVAELSDEDLKAIVNLRKTISPGDRRKFIMGLYYISTVDNDFSDDEQKLVEGTACAFGFTDEQLSELRKKVDEAKLPITLFAFPNNKKFNEMLFEEMGAMTYIKGYQLSVEDEALKEVAEALDIEEEKADKKLQNLYFQAQGYGPSRSTAAKVALGDGGIIAGAAICGLTAGLAAPAVGALIGSGMGLSGAAASSAGLAVLGGGTIAAGGGGMAAGTAAVAMAGAILGGSGCALAVSVSNNIAGAYDQKKLKALIKQQQKDRMTKEQIIGSLIEAIRVQKERLAILEAKQASKRDLATVKLQIANLEVQKRNLLSFTLRYVILPALTRSRSFMFQMMCTFK